MDGQINSHDMVPIGYPTTPEIIYGAGISMGYKNFDFSMFWQGSGRSSFWINPGSITPFVDTDGGDGKTGRNALKNVELGYTLPDKWTKKAHMSLVRLYLSGSNLLCFSNFKLWDPEMAGNGLGYPVQRVFNLGINVSF